MFRTLLPSRTTAGSDPAIVVDPDLSFESKFESWYQSSKFHTHLIHFFESSYAVGGDAIEFFSSPSSFACSATFFGDDISFAFKAIQGRVQCPDAGIFTDLLLQRFLDGDAIRLVAQGSNYEQY